MTKSSRKVSARALLLLLLSLVNFQVLWSQATWGTISGFVTDQSGTGVPGVSVTVTNEQTGLETKVLTASDGLYNCPHLNPGQYSVTAVLSGFDRFVQQHVTLVVDSTVRVDPKLQIGQISQQITVTAGPATIETEKTDVSSTISQNQISNLPVPNYNLTRLFATVPGVTPASFQIFNGENPSEGFMTSVNGQLWMANDYQVDGISDIAWGWSGLQIITPPFDATQELKITTSNFDAEYGSVGGLVAQYVTKGGTNRFHGDAYWFNQNSYFSAANPFTEKIAGTGKGGAGTGPSPYNENVGGVSLGGPIVKNRMFFFGDYRLDRRLQTVRLITTVPTQAFRNGDFSAFASTNPIYDPNTGGALGVGRQQFSCNGVLNVICPGRINPVATNLLALLPLPNIGSGATNNNYVGSGKTSFNTDEIDGRYDWNISERDRLFVRYSNMWSLLDAPGVFGTVAGGTPLNGAYPSHAPSRSQLGAINYTRTFNPNLLSEFRVGVTRFVLNSYQPDAGLATNNQVGIPGINTGSQLTGGLAGINVGGPLGSFFMGVSGSVPGLTVQPCSSL